MPARSDSPCAEPTAREQYQHFIPRFILRRFGVEPARYVRVHWQLSLVSAEFFADIT